MENNIDSSDNLGFSLDSVKHTLQPFTGEMWSFLLVNALRSLKEEQRAGLCFDLYCRSDLREDIDKKISDFKLNEKNINLELMKRNKTFGEAYTIKAIYQEENGLWVNIEDTQLVDVVHGVNEKNNHEEAGRLFMKKKSHLKNLEIKSIIYQ
jgi:hypothetical protein